MMLGPVTVRGQGLPTSRQSSFIKEPVQQHHGHNDYTIPNKQQGVKQTPTDMFFEFGLGEPSVPMSMKQAELYGGNYIPFNEPSQFSMKYSELYAVPKNAKYPEFYVAPGQYNESFYPVDTPNIIPDSSPAADFKQLSQPETKTKPNNDAEMDCLLGGEAFDLNSFLSMPAPPVNDNACVEHDPLNLLGFQPNMDELDLLNPVALGCTIPDGIHYNNGIHKECDNSAPECNITADPIMTTLYGLPLPVDKKNAMETNSPGEPEATQYAVKIEPNGGEDCPMSAVSSNSPGSSENYEDGLRHLFEQTFDLSDLQGEYMLPPPKKRSESENSSSTMYWSMEKTPPLTPAASECVDSPSPQTETNVRSPPTQEQLHKSAKNKPKPPLLFGKHEGEIIHKLLAVSRSTKRKPITRDKLITIAVEEFNLLLEEAHLSEIEVAFMKEWRRRGKNKAAAQIARKRKREEVSGLDEEVQKMRQQKDKLQKRYDHLRSLVESLKKRSAIAEDRLFQKQSQVSMESVSRSTHHIHVTDDDKLLLIPRISSKVLLVKN